MRISDWSSDVCSSDLAAGADIKQMADVGAVDMMLRATHRYWKAVADCPKPIIASVNGFALGGGCELAMNADIIVAGEGAQFGQPEVRMSARSEEHTSELQSLMRISYAVFCLKKKTSERLTN